MRLPLTFLFAGVASASLRVLDSPTYIPSFQVPTRACAGLVSLDTDLIINLPIIGPKLFGRVNGCICISALTVFVQRNEVARLAAAVAGTDRVIAALISLVSTASYWHLRV